MEIERSFGEAVTIREVVDLVNDIEGVGAGSIDVVGHGRGQRVVVGEIEHLVRGTKGNIGGGAFERDDVVSPAELGQ